MRINQLPFNQVKAQEKAFRKSQSPREKIRYQAIWLSARGYPRPEVSQVTGSSQGAIRRWITAYNKEGLTGLRQKPKPGNHRKLTKNQKSQIKKLLKNNSPQSLGYPGEFWNINLLKSLVKDKHQVTYYSPRSYQRLFHWCGFSFHKPNKANKKQSPHMRKRFADIIKKNSQPTGERLVWYW